MIMTTMLQARFVIEYSYVHLMSCSRKQTDRLKKDQLCLLALLADRLEKVSETLSKGFVGGFVLTAEINKEI